MRTNMPDYFLATYEIKTNLNNGIKKYFDNVYFF